MRHMVFSQYNSTYNKMLSAVLLLLMTIMAQPGLAADVNVQATLSEPSIYLRDRVVLEV